MDNSADDAEIARLTRLTGELETAMDNSADEPSRDRPRLTGELETAMDIGAVDDAEIARLQMQIDNDDAASPGLNQQITSLTGERDGLQMRIDNDDADNPGLRPASRDRHRGRSRHRVALNMMITTLTGERDGLLMDRQ